MATTKETVRCNVIQKQEIGTFTERIVMVISHDQELINLTCDEVLNLSDFLTKK